MAFWDSQCLLPLVHETLCQLCLCLKITGEVGKYRTVKLITLLENAIDTFDIVGFVTLHPLHTL